MKWEKVTLGDISNSIQTGPFGSQLHQSDYSEIGIPVIMPKDLINGQISEESIARISDAFVQKLLRHKVEGGDIVYSRRGDVGRCAFVTQKEQGWVCGTGCLKVSIDANKANSKFIFYQLQRKESIKWVENHAVGSTMLNLNTSILSEIPIILPCITIQNKIQNVLSSYDNLIENNQKQIKLLEEAAQRLYKEWFVYLHFPGHETTPIVDGLPEGWKRKKLIDIADIQYGYAFDGSLFSTDKNGTPIVRIRNIPTGNTNDYTSEVADNQYLVYNGDIVVGMDGEFHINTWCGKTAYLVQRTCRIKPKQENVNGWLLQAIYSPIKYYEKTIVGATVAHLGKKHLDSIELLVGTNDLYIPFQKLFIKRQNLLNQINQLSEARDRLLPKLMSGEIEV